MADSGKRGHSGGGGGGNKKAKYYSGSNHKSSAMIPYGCQGFFFTCENGRENKTAHNMIEALEELYTKLRPEEKKVEKPEGDASEDIQAALAAEIADLKDTKAKRFQKVDAGFQKGIGFIKMERPAEGGETPAVTPPELALALMNDIKETKQRKSRFCMRFVPVENVCFASKEKIAEIAKPLIERSFPTGEGVTPFKYSVVHESRASSHLDRMEIIDLVAKMVPQPHTVDLGKPDKSILVSIMKSICMVAILDDYINLAKYNCNMLAMSEEEKEELRQKSQPSKPPAKKEEEKKPETAADQSTTSEPQSAKESEAETPVEAKPEKAE